MINFLDSVLDRVEPHYPVIQAIVYGFAIGVIVMDIAYNG